MNKTKILYNELVPLLTDMKDNQQVFHDAFKQSLAAGHPIRNVLEMGVKSIVPDINPDFFGQSTKILLILCDEFRVPNFVSLDIDDCLGTIDRCKKWVSQYGVKTIKHKFIQSNSIEYDVTQDFPKGIDLLFVDTSHDDDFPIKIGYPGSGGAGMTYREICYYAPHITVHGKMFLHDTKNFYVPRGKGKNTEGAIELFMEEHPGWIFKEHDKNRHGLGEMSRS